MSKKKRTHTHIVNHNTLEIDYAKLAEAIVQANQKKESSKSNLRIKMVSFLNGMMYSIGYIASAFTIFNIWNNSILDNWVENLVLTSLFLVIGVCFFIAQQESHSDTEKDVISHFNNNIGIASILMAVVALIMQRGAL